MNVDPRPSIQTAPLNFRPKKIKNSILNSTEKAIDELQKISKTLSQPIPIPEANEFDAFGKYISVQLHKLPETVALESMAFIVSFNPATDKIIFQFSIMFYSWPIKGQLRL